VAVKMKNKTDIFGKNAQRVKKELNAEVKRIKKDNKWR